MNKKLFIGVTAVAVVAGAVAGAAYYRHVLLDALDQVPYTEDDLDRLDQVLRGEETNENTDRSSGTGTDVGGMF